MGDLLRTMLINTTNNTTVNVTIMSDEPMSWFQLDTNEKTPPTEADGDELTGQGTWTIPIRPGEIYGLVAKAPFDITNPNSAAVTIVTANGKDPWPQPPPKSQLQSRIDDYAIRYQYFLTANGQSSRPSGQWKLTLSPVSRSTLRSRATPAAPQRRKAFALLVAGYDPGGAAATAPYATTAICIIEKELRSRFAEQDLIVTLQYAPTQVDTTNEMDRLRALLSGGDLLIVMFAGHGAEAIGTQLSEAWQLSRNQLLTDEDLAAHLPKASEQSDVVVISDCCYGRGALNPGQGEPPNVEITDEQQADKLRQQSKVLPAALARFWTKSGSLGALSDATMVCISGASANRAGKGEGDQIGPAMKLLATNVASAAEDNNTYADLRETFGDGAPGRYFYVDARPEERLTNIVLDTIASLQS